MRGGAAEAALAEGLSSAEGALKVQMAELRQATAQVREAEARCAGLEMALEAEEERRAAVEAKVQGAKEDCAAIAGELERTREALAQAEEARAEAAETATRVGSEAVLLQGEAQRARGELAEGKAWGMEVMEASQIAQAEMQAAVDRAETD